MKVLKIKYIKKGWYTVKSRNNLYYCKPRQGYCSCPSIRLCKHLKEIGARVKDGTIGF